MKAIVQDKYGSADVLQLLEVDKPVVGDSDVLVKVRAASANPLDWHIMRGTPFFVRFVSGLTKPKQPVRGVDVAGVVEAVGKGVTAFKQGDEVYGFCSGAFAEYAKADESRLVPRPDNLTPQEAAAIPIAALTALQGLRDLGKVGSGHRVLIIGASGGVGTFAVQIAKSYGAEVTGSCSTRNIDLVRSIGADDVLDYTQGKITNSGREFDVIFQLAGTDSPAKLRKLLTPTGTLVLSSGMGRLSGIDRIIKSMVSKPFVKQRQVTWVADENQADLAILADMAAAGTIVPVIDRTYGLSEAAEAMRYVMEGHTQGKVVVTVD